MATVRHVYECPMRWADLDPLGHVNNVVYVDYLQEARVDMLRAHATAPDRAEPTGAEQSADDLAEGVVVVSHSVTYLQPLHFRQGAGGVLIDCWVSEIRAATFTMACELYHLPAEPGGERVVYARATTVLTPYVFGTGLPRRLTAQEQERLRRFVEPGFETHPKRVRRLESVRDRPGATLYQVNVRFSDVDAYRHVNNVKYFEFFQESRIQALSALAPDLGLGPAGLGLVLAHTDVSYQAPILHRPEPYECWTAVTEVGRTSFKLASEIRDGETVLSSGTMVLVFFDRDTERATEPPPELREALVNASPD